MRAGRCRVVPVLGKSRQHHTARPPFCCANPMIRLSTRESILVAVIALLAAGWIIDRASFEKRVAEAEFKWQNENQAQLEQVRASIRELAGKLRDRFSADDVESAAEGQ